MCLYIYIPPQQHHLYPDYPRGFRKSGLVALCHQRAREKRREAHTAIREKSDIRISFLLRYTAIYVRIELTCQRAREIGFSTPLRLYPRARERERGIKRWRNSGGAATHLSKSQNTRGRGSRRIVLRDRYLARLRTLFGRSVCVCVCLCHGNIGAESKM